MSPGMIPVGLCHGMDTQYGLCTIQGKYPIWQDNRDLFEKIIKMNRPGVLSPSLSYGQIEFFDGGAFDLRKQVSQVGVTEVEFFTQVIREVHLELLPGNIFINLSLARLDRNVMQSGFF